MVRGDRNFWSRCVSPALAELVPGAVNGVSSVFVDHLPLEDCADFVWALACITRAAPPELLNRYKYDRPGLPTPEALELLLEGAVASSDFYGFPEKSLRRLFFRLRRNVDDSPDNCPEEEAHVMALTRIEDIIMFLAQKHPNAAVWLKAAPEAKREPVAKLAASAATKSPNHRLTRKRPDYLRLIK